MSSEIPPCWCMRHGSGAEQVSRNSGDGGIEILRLSADCTRLMRRLAIRRKRHCGQKNFDDNAIRINAIRRPDTLF
jgi:hypothetical protein